MKKITIFTMQLKTPGGIERFVSTLSEMFSNDYAVEIVANYGKASDTLAFPLPKNVKVTFLTSNQPKEISMKKILLGLKWHRIPKELVRRKKIDSTREKVFKNFLQTLNTDYIITDRAVFSSLIGKYYHGNAVKIATDHNYHQNNPVYIKELIESVNGFDHLVVATDELKEFYTSRTAVKCHKINNPLANIPVKKAALDTDNIISVGRFVPEKDFETLVDVMAIVHRKLPQAHLTIIGDGITFDYVSRKVKTMGLEDVISLPGFMTQDKIAEYYYNSSLFVLTSRTEAFGLVLTEAMSYGLPCIAFSRASGARAQINSRNGYLIKEDDIFEMADKIIYALNNKEKLKTVQGVINQDINNYSQGSVRQAWDKILA